MILSPNNEPVAVWTLRITDGAAYLEAGFEVLRVCCDVLAREGLFHPEWLVLDPFGREERVPWQEVDLCGFDDANVHGYGWTLDAAGERHSSPYVMFVQFDTRMGCLTFSTWSDAWLPEDLAGVPQPEVHARNAPRLAAALREVARLTRWRLTNIPCRWTTCAADGLTLLGMGDVRDFLRPWPPDDRQR